jgi:hypothetical protein
MTVGQWSTTAANNVLSSGTVGTGGVNVDEGMAPDLVNNAMRDIMAQIKTFQMGAYFGHTAQLAIGGNTDAVELFGTTAATGGLALGMFNATATTAAHIDFYRSKNAAIGSATVVASGDVLGSLNFYGAQQTGTFATQTQGAQIRAEVNGTVTSGASADMPTKIVFATTPDGSGICTDWVEIDNAGLLTLNQGQIHFPASQQASANVNVLDDYEEGTWTPSVTSSTGTITTVGTVSGWYRKIGGIVTVFADATITTNGTGAGYINIAGLPFTSTAAGAVNGKETATEKALAGFLSNGTTTLTHITFYDGTYPGANGNRFLVACSYPAA